MQRTDLTRLLHRLGGSAAAHPWRTLGAWLLVAVLAAGLAAAVGGEPHDVYEVPGSRSQAGTDLLRAEFPQAAGAADRVVVHDRAGDGLDPAVLRQLRERLLALPRVVAVPEPRLASSGHTALLDVRYDVPVTDEALFANLEPLEGAIAPLRAAGLQVELGGETPESASLDVGGTGEALGVLVALVLLALTFGSVLAAGLPILVALVGLGVGACGVLLLARVTDVSTTAPTVATMVGLGVGIDYALLLVTRHVELVRQGLTDVEAAAWATATAGRSVLFAGATVLVSLLGLRLTGLQTYSSFGFATATTVICVVAASLTLVPALLGLGGKRLLPRAVRTGRDHPTRTPWSQRWALRVGRRPLPWALGALGLLLVLALPVLDLRMWPTDNGAQPEGSTTRESHDLVEAAFGPGANGPFVVAVDRARVSDLESLRTALAATRGVAQVGPADLSPSGRAAVIVLEPTTAPSDERTSALVDRLRADVLPAGAELTGQTPVLADITDLLADRIWRVIGFVVTVSLLLLVLVFRSLVVPVKAALMNLLSIAAAYGVVVAVFQWGWGAGLLGLDHAVPVSSWVPMLMFAVAFGLSMDYEVFLLGRVREDWLRTGDAHGSVVSGLASTGRLITAAAAIMVSVFLGFAAEGDLVLKQVGVGMAAAIVVDATVVRMVLVPASMALLGRANWWLPVWLDRLLPALDLEGPAVPAQRPPLSPPSHPASSPAPVA